MMRWWLCLLLSVPTAAMAAEPFARARIENAKPIVAGQQVHLTVEVLAPNYFTSPPQFPLFDLPDAMVTLPEERARTAVQSIDGTQYSMIAHTYVIVPQSPGTFDVPPIRIELGYFGDSAPVEAVAATQPVSFDVAAGTNGADGSTPAEFAARDLEITETFDRDPARLQTGDTLVRTISITAADTQSLLMPPVDFGLVDGLRQYLRQPVLTDNVAQGRRTVSRRTETIAYTLTAAGSFALPKIDYPWFDLDAHEPAVAALPARTIIVSKAPAVAGITPAFPDRETHESFEERRAVAIRILGTLLLIGLVWRARELPEKIARTARNALTRLSQSRRYRLRQLKRTIDSAELCNVYAALQQWSRSEGYHTLHAWASAHQSELPGHIQALEARLFGDKPDYVDRKRIAALVARGEKQRLVRASSRHLHALNPISKPR
ncbi:BatD family protein [Rhizobium sp. CNPSo 4039]|uniref:BatD family protein n=1 Tax=Rhizobium sp. CNPSo 4039 TaxID=3021409 RepID=UPI00254C4FD1|nr:BatD family protein [Rhizobium sp. CNPSo 4039]MDK4717267.1 BatD family protein [Rhizobium sp. CNPSo 4039]